MLSSREAIVRWAQTLNELATVAGRQNQPVNGTDVRSRIYRLFEIGGQLPFDLRASASEKLYRYEQFQRVVRGNRFVGLFEYIQRESAGPTSGNGEYLFWEVQRELGLHMGLFAYVDIEGNAVRYLYGPYDDERDLLREPPHFFIKAFFEYQRPMSEPIWLEEPSWQFARMSEAFYYTRVREGAADDKGPWGVPYISIFKEQMSTAPDDPTMFPVTADRRRAVSAWERQQGALYAPSGEIDTCILYWLLLHLPDDVRRSLAAWCRSIVVGDLGIQEPERFVFDLSEVAIRRKRKSRTAAATEESHYWGQGRARSITRWLERLGLVWIRPAVGSRATPRGAAFLTAKGCALLEWLDWYLRKCRDDSNNGYLPVERLHHSVWLDDVPADVREAFFKLNDARLAAMPTGLSVPEAADLRAVAAAVLVLLTSTFPASDTAPAVRSVDFALRCRMALHPHLTLRAGARYRGIHENVPRAWLVLPVLHAHRGRLGMDTPGDRQDNLASETIVPVGFFLGTVRDLDAQGRTNPLFDPSSRDALAARIAAIRALIQPLAEIENRETFFYDIDRRRSHDEWRDAIRAAIRDAGTGTFDGQTSREAVQKVLAWLVDAKGVAWREVDDELDRSTLLDQFQRRVHALLHTWDGRRPDFERAALALSETIAALRRRDVSVASTIPYFVATDVNDLQELQMVVQSCLAEGIRDQDDERQKESLALRVKARLRHDDKAFHRTLQAVFGLRVAETDHVPTNLRLRIVAVLNEPPLREAVRLGTRAITPLESVIDKHFASVVRTVRHDRDSWIVSVGGTMKREEKHGDAGGGYYVGDAEDPLAKILRGAYGSKWVQCMLPFYFDPVFLETRSAGVWRAWNLSAFVRGQSATVTHETLWSYGLAPIALDSVRFTTIIPGRFVSS